MEHLCHYILCVKVVLKTHPGSRERHTHIILLEDCVKRFSSTFQHQHNLPYYNGSSVRAETVLAK